MYAVVEVDAADRLVKIVQIVDEREELASRYAAQLNETDLDKAVRRFRLVAAGIPLHLEEDAGDVYCVA